MDAADGIDLSRAVRDIAHRLQNKVKLIATASEPRQPPFRFFGLPKNIRVLVYRALPLQIKHDDVKYEDRVCLTLITRGLPLAILRTCKRVHDEAKPVFEARIHREIISVPLRIILRGEVDTSLATRHNTYMVLSAIAHAVEAAKKGMQRRYKSIDTILLPAEDEMRLFKVRSHDPSYSKMPFLSSTPTRFSASLSKFVVQAARSKSATPIVQLVFCLPGYDMQWTHGLGHYPEYGFKWKKDSIGFSSNGVNFMIAGFVEKPCIEHYKKVLESEICRKCSPGKFWVKSGDEDDMICSYWVDLEEWTGEWMESP